MQYGSYLRLDFRRIKGEGKEVKIVKLSNPNENSVLVIVKTKTRDAATGKFKYVTEQTVELFQTTPQEVIGVVAASMEKATGEKLPATVAAAPAAKKGK